MEVHKCSVLQSLLNLTSVAAFLGWGRCQLECFELKQSYFHVSWAPQRPRGSAEPRGVHGPAARSRGEARYRLRSARGRATRPGSGAGPRAPPAPGGAVGLRQLREARGPRGDRAPAPAPARPRARPPASLRCSTPLRTRAASSTKREMKCSWAAAIAPRPQQLPPLPKWILSTSGNKSCSWQWGCIVLAATRTPADGEQHIAAQPNVLIAETHSVCGKHIWDVNLICRKQNVPVFYLCRTRNSACGTGRKAAALSLPETATAGCLLQPFCPGKVHVSLSKYRITFLIICIWTVY